MLISEPCCSFASAGRVAHSLPFLGLIWALCYVMPFAPLLSMGPFVDLKNFPLWPLVARCLPIVTSISLSIFLLVWGLFLPLLWPVFRLFLFTHVGSHLCPLMPIYMCCWLLLGPCVLFSPTIALVLLCG